MNPEIFSANKFNFETDSLSKNALSVISRLHKKKFKAYIVGGGIRENGMEGQFSLARRTCVLCRL